MYRTDQTIMYFISNMRIMCAYFAAMHTTHLLLFILMNRTPRYQCNGEYQKQKYGENLAGM